MDSTRARGPAGAWVAAIALPRAGPRPRRAPDLARWELPETVHADGRVAEHGVAGRALSLRRTPQRPARRAGRSPTAPAIVCRAQAVLDDVPVPSAPS